MQRKLSDILLVMLSVFALTDSSILLAESLTKTNQVPIVPLNKNNSSKSSSWMQLMEPPCIQEYKEATAYCEAPDNRPKLKQLSPDCQKQIDSGQRKENFSLCSKELEAALQTMHTGNEQCVHSRVSPKCKEQFYKALHGMQEEKQNCTKVIQKVYQICGQAPNVKCYSEHQAEIDTACNN